MKVLIAADDSQSSAEVLRTVATQFKMENTEVLILHVLQPAATTPPQMAPGYAPELEDEKELAQRFLDGCAKKLRDAGFRTDTVIKIGDVRETIIDSADEWGADLIVLGSHGRKGVRRFLLGSVAADVARHSNCSVEIVRSSENR